MKFVDEIEIRVRGGHGGAGCVSFYREKFRPDGGPDGGDGGRGGDVILKAHSSLQTLGNLMKAKLYAASNGEPGRGRNKSGSAGEALTLYVPIGTEILDAQSRERLADLHRPEDEFIVARGGKGGLGNQHFATSVNQTPTYAQPGLPGDEINLLLRLKLLADAGLVGLPNAGKSTLLSAVSRNHPKIADYAFTTLTPNIGVVQNQSYRRLLLADIPGIIEGASKGQGLGLSFLRHIERVRLIVYVIDSANLEAPNEIKLLQSELREYAPELVQRPALVVMNKTDLMDYDQDFADEVAASLREPALWQESTGVPDVLYLSAAEGKGTDAFIEKLFDYFPEPTLAEESLPQPEKAVPAPVDIEEAPE